jgi:hypothetical protein
MRTHLGITRVGMCVAAVALAWSMFPSRAAGQAETPAVEKVKVVGHLALPGMHINQMFVQRVGKKDLLYLHRPNKRAFAVVDVTNPEKPGLMDSAALQGPARQQLAVAGSDQSLGIATTPEAANGTVANGNAANAQASAPVTLSTETVKILDLGDPAHPRVIKTFAGVTSMLPDDSRKLIYIANGEGLWIVRHRQTHPMPFCTSEDALTQEPNCQ